MTRRVTEANTARTDLDGLDYADYVPLGNDKLTAGGTGAGGGVFTFDANDEIDGDINLSALELYANALLSMPQVATVSEVEGMEGVTNTDDSNFDAAGRLIVPMSLQNTDDDVETDEVLAPIKEDQLAERMVSDIRSVRDQTRAAADALTELRDDNLNPALQTIYDEAARRAQVEAEYYDGVYEAMLGDNTNQNPDTNPDDDTADGSNDSTPYSIASRNSEFQTQDNKRFVAEQTLRGAVADREAATEGVRGAFNTPQSFYEQLVARRQALKVAADRKVAAAAEDGGTVPENVTDAATDAAEALAAAEEAQATAVAAFGDEDGPTAALVAELLKTGGDDGQALVDAIAATYETAAGAADAAREVVNELTGEGGAVATNTAGIATNATNIENNSNAIIDIEGRGLGCGRQQPDRYERDAQHGKPHHDRHEHDQHRRERDQHHGLAY